MRKLFNKFFQKPMRIGVCHFELFTVDNKPFRADYTLIPDDQRFTKEFLITRSWPQFLEHNIGKVESNSRSSVLEELPRLISYYEGGKEIPIPMHPSENEKFHADFTVELFLGRNLYINNYFKNAVYREPIEPIKVDVAFENIAIWTFGLALCRLDKKSANELKFFIAYGLRKWKREGLPKAITAFTPTWDFSNVDKMIKDWNTWESNKRDSL